MEGLDEDINIIKSLIAITKGGLLVSKIGHDYLDMTGTRLNFRKYGFNSLDAMLKSSPDIVLQTSSEGMLCKVNDEKINHVVSLVERTRGPRPNKKKNKPFKKSFSFRPKQSFHGSFRNVASPQRDQFRTRPAVPFSNYGRPLQPINRSGSFSTQGNMANPQVHKTGFHQYSYPERQHQYQNAHKGSFTNPSPRSNSFPKQVCNPQNFSTTKQNEEVRYQILKRPSSSTTNGSNMNVQLPQVQRSMCNSVREGSLSSHSNQENVNGELFKRNSDDSQHHVPLPLKQKSEAKIVRSDSCSSWSTDSSNISNQGDETIGPSAHQFWPRVVELQTRKAGIGHSSASSLSITIPRNESGKQDVIIDSDSDWSSDSDEPVSISQACSSDIPSRSSTAARSLVPSAVIPKQEDCSTSGRPQISNSFKPDPLMKKAYNSHDEECPLMVGGVGRGKKHNNIQVVKSILTPNPGIKDRMSEKPQASSKELTDCKKGLVVGMKPNKREVTTSAQSDNSSILVKVTNSTPAKATPTFKKTPIQCSDNSYKDFEFIGDMYLERVAEVCLGLPAKRARQSYNRLCNATLTISQCEKEILNYGAPENIILMIGMTDILQGAKIQDLKEDVTALLQRLENCQILLLTLPVPPTFIKCGFEKQLGILVAYNKWLLKLDLPNKIDIDSYLYCDGLFFERYRGSMVETLSEDGCWIVMDEIYSTLC